MYDPSTVIPDPELEVMSDEFIQSQIDYFDSLRGTSGYWFGRCYRDEKYRREQMIKQAREQLCEE